MTDPTILQARLAEAEAALHVLMMGGQTAAVRDSAGRQVNYTAASIGELSGYIASLKQQLGIGRRRAIGVVF